MEIVDTYSKLSASHSNQDAHPVFRAWGYSDQELAHWFSESTPQMVATAKEYVKNVPSIVAQIESFFGQSLPGQLVLIPSMAEIDGFARYELGNHSVLLGVDFPGVSLEYLKALTAHELSHVYRDHCADVWGFLNKPLREVSRQEYLDAGTAREHLVSEGLATLTSQAIYPEISNWNHHYYQPAEMDWCMNHYSEINDALVDCLNAKDPNPWKFYGNHVVSRGSPSRTHYYWAARKIADWIQSTAGMTLLKAHSLHADQIQAF